MPVDSRDNVRGLHICTEQCYAGIPAGFRREHFPDSDNMSSPHIVPAFVLTALTARLESGIVHLAMFQSLNIIQLIIPTVSPLMVHESARFPSNKSGQTFDVPTLASSCQSLELPDNPAIRLRKVYADKPFVWCEWMAPPLAAFHFLGHEQSVGENTDVIEGHWQNGMALISLFLQTFPRSFASRGLVGHGHESVTWID